MNQTLGDNPTNDHPSDETIGIHVLHYLTTHQMNGARIQFNKLKGRLGVDRVRLARVIGCLDRQGLVDASTLRATLAGFAIGSSLSKADLPPLHAQPHAA